MRAADAEVKRARRKVIREHIIQESTHDIEGLLAGMTKDCSCAVNISPRVFRGPKAVAERYRLPCYATGVGAKGSVIYSKQQVREYRDAVGIDERISYLAWLFQQNRGVFKSPWTTQETWTLSVFHTEDDAARYVANFEEFAVAVAS